MKKKLLMFDLDGTIADTIWSIREAVNIALGKYGLPLKDYEQIRIGIGNGAADLVRRVVPEEKRGDEEFVGRVIADFSAAYSQTYTHIDGCYPYMDEALHTLKERGYTVAVLSNKPDAFVKKIIEILFPDGTVSYAAGQTELPKKPDPTVPLMIAAQFGARPEECAFIGDSDVDVFTAKNSGFASVACSWGYRPIDELKDADFLIDSAEELLSIFE